MDQCKIKRFCYVCGCFVAKSAHPRLTSNETFKRSYEYYFDQLVFENEPYVPDIVCGSCHINLWKWSQKKLKIMPFKVPMMWTKLSPHNDEDCYGCKNFFKGIEIAKPGKINYTSTQNGQRPILNEADAIAPKFPSPDLESWLASSENTQPSTESSDWQPSVEPSTSREASKQPIPVTEEQLNRIVAELELSKRKSEILASFLKKHKILSPGVKVTGFRKRQEELQNFFHVTEDKKSAFCNNIELLMRHMGINYDANEWRLFIDSSSNSLKAVLLHTTNKKPIIPIAYSTDTHETYARMKDIIEKVEYKKHNWRVCCDLKVTAMLCGLQAGWTKRPCFICEWDSRYKEQYTRNDWSYREASVHRTANVINPGLVPKGKILLPPLHVKLGIVMSFIKTVVKNTVVYERLKLEFPQLSEKKIKNGSISLYVHYLISYV